MKDKKIIGFIAGSFDVIHPGYIKMFKQAKDYCNYLIIGLHKDPSIERQEKMKPILTVDERIEILKSIIYIDDVMVYENENNLVELLKNIKPDIRFLGDDYIDKKYTGENIAKNVIFLNRNHGWSTTLYKNKIYDNYCSYKNKNL